MSANTGAMTEKERVKAVLRREKPDRVPRWTFFDVSGFAAVYHNRPIIDAYRDPAESLKMQRKVCEDFGWVCSTSFFTSLLVDLLGGEMKLPDSEFSQAPTVTRYPIESEGDVRNMKMPDLESMIGTSRQKAFFDLAAREQSANEPFKISLHPIGPFDMAGFVCRMENMTRWMLRKPEVLHEMLHFCTDFMVAVIKYWADTYGTEDVLPKSGGVRCSNQIISPKQFEQFALPYQKECHQRILDLGYKHLYTHVCGDHNKNLPYWQEIPMGDPGLISFGHEVDLETAGEYFPNDVIVGNLEPAIVQTGTPEQVYNATRQVVEKGKKLGGRYIFSLGCGLPPRASLDNIKAMNQAVDDFGWY